MLPAVAHILACVIQVPSHQLDFKPRRLLYVPSEVKTAGNSSFGAFTDNVAELSNICPTVFRLRSPPMLHEEPPHVSDSFARVADPFINQCLRKNNFGIVPLNPLPFLLSCAPPKKSFQTGARAVERALLRDRNSSKSVSQKEATGRNGQHVRRTPQ